MKFTRTQRRPRLKIGVPKEIKTHEYRVGLTPAGCGSWCRTAIRCWCEQGAAAGIGFDDDAYRAAGATVAADAAAVFAEADMIVKVKEPQPAEIARAAPRARCCSPICTSPPTRRRPRGLMHSGATCIAYETVTDRAGGLPLLAPMSEVAGRMSVQVGAHCLESEQGGAGILLGGVPGVPPARVVVLGGGVAGTNAARMAVGLEACGDHHRPLAAAAEGAGPAVRRRVPPRCSPPPRRSSRRCWPPTW